MAAPLPFAESPALDARLVTKTSLPNPRAAIALLIMLWFQNGKPGSVVYGRPSGASSDGGIIDDVVIDAVQNYASRHNEPLGVDEIASFLKGNPLLESQMESLNSAFELVWRLGTFSFTNPTLARTAERTGGIRYQKQVRYTVNLDLLNILSEPNPGSFAGVLLNWIGAPIACDKVLESQLIRMLAVFSSGALFKTSKGDEGTVFTVSGVYDALLHGNETVDIVDPEKEVQGTTRILKPAISSGLFPDLAIKGNAAAFVEGKDRGVLAAYAERMHVSDKVSKVKLNIGKKSVAKNKEALPPVSEPHNLIFFGAPGTGKSHQLNQLAKGPFAKENVSRVTFYPDYTYSQFVGCYKPCTNESGDITYGYVAGPFLDTYLNACMHPYEQYVLIIEEINRANPAAVFGDVFQLLDRSVGGWSEYSVSVPDDMKKHIAERLSDLSKEERSSIEAYYDPDMDFGEFSRSAENDLALPPNMFIWATMNSADQGVYPMDTAFKRRWDFRYIGIDDGEDAKVTIEDEEKRLSDVVVSWGTEKAFKTNWNVLRKAINDFLSNDVKLNEDKLLGPFFVSPSSLADARFGAAFKDKVLLYLYEDACKTKHPKVFASDLNTYTAVCEAFDERGTDIFVDGFKSYYKGRAIAVSKDNASLEE
ncbi:AAA family ATPase [Senegalimassilia anaerobia]|uniref:ATPase dynein-related AAA domain-containing protein n=1 Tax=Senegalimassilia anaerobia TaxID=1473216 RepID=A0A369LCC9_9ACTN|nr:AAA family ATPase [Senegalimassilia anaerobia]RDB57293.1 hypothetical protein C1880_00235 [Senegalimassilia anaerobia]